MRVVTAIAVVDASCIGVQIGVIDFRLSELVPTGSGGQAMFSASSEVALSTESE